MVPDRAGRTLLVSGAERGIVVEQTEHAAESRPAECLAALVEQGPVGGCRGSAGHQPPERSRVGGWAAQSGELELPGTAEHSDQARGVHDGASADARGPRPALAPERGGADT